MSFKIEIFSRKTFAMKNSINKKILKEILRDESSCLRRDFQGNLSQGKILSKKRLSMSTFLIKKNGVERYKLPTPLF